MNGKKFCLLLVAFVALFLLLGALNTANATNVDFNVTSNVDDNIIGTVSIDDNGNMSVKKIQTDLGLNNPQSKLYFENDTSQWKYSYLENNGIKLGLNDYVFGNEPNNLIAIYVPKDFVWVDVVRDFDDTIIMHSGFDVGTNKKISGIENSAGLQNDNLQKIVDTEYGHYEYQYLLDEYGTILNSNNWTGPLKVNTVFTAVYKKTPYMFAEINAIDEHGHAGGGSTYPAMKKSGDTTTHPFKPFTDVDPAYTPLYIQDLETNLTYNPGDSYTITYDDVAKTGTTRMVKNFQYMYEKIPTFNAEITVIDPQGNADRYATFPGMKPGDSLPQTFADLVDYDSVHYDFWYIIDETGKIYSQPGDTYTITYEDCLAVNDNISKVFTYTYGYFPDYTVTYISVNPNGVFDNVTITVNRENWSAFYTLPEAPEIKGKVLDYIRIVEDDVYNYKPGSTYEAMYDMCMSEGNNLTRTFEYNYKEGAYANVTVNYIINATGSEYDGWVFNSILYPYIVVGEELVGGYVFDYPRISDFEFVSVTYSEEIVNGVKAMVDGSDVTDIGGFWVYEVTETGDIDLNFLYNYVSTKVDPTPEPTPTPAPGNDTWNDTNETDPVVPEPIVPDVPVENETVDNSTTPVNPTPVPITPIDNKIVDNNTNSTNISNITAKAVSDDSNVIRMSVTGKNPWIAVAVLIVFILVFVVGYYIDQRSEE